MSDAPTNVPHSVAVPGRLFVAAEAGVDPPVDSRLQELPFDKLAWQNFERLCHRLARSEADVKACRIYGDAGHEQHGIDLFARRAGREKWTVYQCKRVQDFGPSLIEAAVQEFLRGELVDRSERFVLCTSENLRAPPRLQAIERMRDELRPHGVELEVWDAEELNTKLKAHPLLVADFFHEAWARSFCTVVPDNLAQRLSAPDVHRFRENCRAFYEQCFAQADAGWINSGSSGRPIPPLSRRFIGRDVVEKRLLGFDQLGAPSQADPFPAEPEGDNPGSPKRRPANRSPSSQRLTEVKTPLPDWLAHGGQFVLAGEPGAGKSTVLRFLALDLLAPSPTLTRVGEAWGDHLPVWVPFPLWTRRIAERGATAVSLVELLREWFTSYSNGHLWPLVERALADDRLLLFVDGLDEWRDESAARVALQLLHVFVGQRKTPAVLTGRPQGLSALGPFPAGYREAVLAPLNRVQQREFVERLLENGDSSAHQADGFFRDLEQLPALRTTAGIPLLLGLLLRQHLEHARLPLSRFLAGERMVDTLLRDHPIRRQQAALLCSSPLLAERELREALSCVAWRMHTERPEGMVEGEAVREWLLDFLTDEENGWGYARSEARRISDELLRHGEREFGILVEKAPGWFGFFHRTIQELLAAEHLGTMPRPAQISVLRERASHSDWREVLLAWCHHRSTPDFAEIVATLKEVKTSRDVTTAHRAAEFLAELATGGFRLPPNLARRLVGNAVETTWTSEWPRHRRRLLDLVLDGLHGSHAVRSIVQAAVRAWYPGRSGTSHGLAATTAKWPSSPELTQALLRTLHREEESAQRSAAKALGVFAAHDPTLSDQLAHLAKASIRPTTCACALDAFANGNPDDPRLLALAERGRRSGSSEVSLTAIKILVRKNIHTAGDLKIVLRHARKRSFRVGYHWGDDLIDVLLSGCPGSAVIRASAIESLAKGRRWADDGMEHEMAFPILIRGFSGHEDAAAAIAKFFQREKFLISGLQGSFREWLPGCARWFSVHPEVAQAVETYLFRDAIKDDYSFAQSSLLAHTERVKNHLLERVRQSRGLNYWPIWALIHGWGINDATVLATLREIVTAHPESAANLAELAPQVFPTRHEAREKLMLCFGAEKVSWPWLLLSGLVAIDGHLRSPDVLDACFRLKSRASAWEQERISRHLIEHASQVPSVRALALVELDAHDGELPCVAVGFKDDPEITSRIIETLAPLPAELRAVIVDRLESLPIGDTFADEMLARFDLECDGDVKARAAVAYVRRLRASGPLPPALVAQLRLMLHAVGFDNEERRAAALAALLELREFDAIKTEFSGRFSHGHWLFAETSIRNKETLLNLLAKHWAELKQALGDDAFVEFTHQNSTLSFASHLAAFIESTGAAHEWLETVFSATAREEISYGLLNYLVRTEPNSDRLLTLCLGVLRGSVKTHLHGWGDQVRTARLVATNWGGNVEVLSRLTTGFDATQLPEPVALALALGWADSEALINYHQTCANEKRAVSAHVWHSLGAAFSPPARFAKTVTRFAIRRGGRDAYIFVEVANYYVARLRRDDEAKRAFLAELRRAKSPDVRVTLAGLLVRAAPGWAEFNEWRAHEIAEETAHNPKAEFGLNLATSNVENLYAILTEEAI
jgi:hypothetical protein